ncbi:MAG: glycosyltransferase family A protein [Luteimonas sp.]
MSDPLHTFVVPAYGHSAHLRECLASLRAQTRPSPIVIATSTPFEGLAALADEHGARLAIHTPNVGIGRDWNFALAQATTPWVTIAHQDDIYLPHFTEKTMGLVVEHPDSVLVMTDYGEWHAGRQRLTTPMLMVKRLLLEFGFLGRSSLSRTGAKLRLLRFGCPIACPSVTLRASATTLRFREDLKVNLDWDAWMRLAVQDGAFAYVRDVSMLHRIHTGSETSDAIRQGVRADEDLMMFRSLWPEPVARLLARAYSLSYETGSPR